MLYPWPGNVRELKNAASQLVVRGSGGPEGWIAVHHLPPAILEAYRDAREASPDASPASTAEAPPSAASDAPDEHGDADARPPREQLLDALERHNWNISAVAREFDRHRPQIYRWMRYLGIDPKGDG